jgi:hypothetical protein
MKEWDYGRDSAEVDYPLFAADGTRATESDV